MCIRDREKDVIAAFDRDNEILYQSAWKSQFLSGMMMPIMQFVGNLGYVAVVILGGYLAIKKTIEVGDIQSFIQYVRSFTQPIQQVAQVANMLQSTAAASEQMCIRDRYFLCITEKFAVGKGDILIFLCALVFSIHILVIDYFSPKVDGVKMSCIQFFVCGIVSLPPMFFTETPKIGAIVEGWAPLLYAGVLSCGVAYTLQIIGQKNVNPAVASLILSLESCFSVLAGWMVLGEKLSMRESVGCVLMFAAIILAQLPDRKKEELQYE